MRSFSLATALVCAVLLAPSVHGQTSGQSAFAVITETVKILRADPATDWTRVNIEALRQHLIDMDEVMMRATVVSRDVPDGAAFTITGTGRTLDAIKRMIPSHAAALDRTAAYAARATVAEGSVTLTVTAKSTDRAKVITQIRGLGFAGLLVEDDHHAMHHMALARGAAMAHDR